LTLREPADAAARAPELVSEVRSHLSTDGRVAVHDLGSGTGSMARWLAAHPPAPGGQEETVLQDPFDYAAEDRLVGAWRAALATLPEVNWQRAPGWTLSYSGPGGRARSSAEFE